MCSNRDCQFFVSLYMCLFYSNMMLDVFVVIFTVYFWNCQHCFPTFLHSKLFQLLICCIESIIESTSAIPSIQRPTSMNINLRNRAIQSDHRTIRSHVNSCDLYTHMFIFVGRVIPWSEKILQDVLTLFRSYFCAF